VTEKVPKYNTEYYIKKSVTQNYQIISK